MNLNENKTNVFFFVGAKEATIITITIIITHNYILKPRLTRYLSENHISKKENVQKKKEND